MIKYWGGKGDKEQEERKNLKAAQDLLQHLVDLAHPGRGDVLFGVVGVPSRASAENKQAMLEAARNVLDSVMIVSEPFTVAYGMERMSDILVIDIGAGTTDLCRMHGTVPGPDDEIDRLSRQQRIFPLSDFDRREVNEVAHPAVHDEEREVGPHRFAVHDHRGVEAHLVRQLLGGAFGAGVLRNRQGERDLHHAVAGGVAVRPDDRTAHEASSSSADAGL